MIVLYCDFCGEIISEETLKKRHGNYKFYKRHYCNKEHDMADRRRSGYFKRLSQAGNAAMKGSIDIHERRSSAMKRSNKENPRRKKAIT